MAAASKLATMRHDHLRKSSQSLTVASPAVSSHLRILLMEQTSSSGQKDVLSCTGCGAILLPGLNCTRIHTRQNGSGKRTRQDRLNQMPGVKRMTWECSSCQTIKAVESPKQMSARHSKHPSKEITASAISKERPPVSVPAAQVAAATNSSESGVKKRGRGKKSTLQSMLADRKTTQPVKGFGLKLNDFMKS